MVKPMKFDVVIIGGGLVGGTLAVALAQQNFKVAVIDRESPEELLKPDLDGRTTAVSYGSKLIFDQLGIWDKVEHAAEPILDIRVFERDSPWAIYYNHQDVGNVPMGYIVENRVLRQGIFQRAVELSAHLTWMAPASVAHTERNLESIIVELDDGNTLKASLLIGAEGRLSPTRDEAGIKTFRWSYEKMALIAHVTHEKPHQGSAWEVFQPQGPFAILPLKTCPTTGSYRSGIVWTGSPSGINQLLSLDDEMISAELQELFPYFGTIRVSGKRWSYPLSAMVARGTIDHRLAIVGDAAHTIHPVAGQGVNLGWRDAQTLAEVLGKAKGLGLDIGAKSILQNYQRRRRVDTASILAMSDGMVRLFSNKSSMLSFLRNTGLGIVNQIPPLKRRLMRHAMGI
ncbi:MAG: UbiH/UbiF/VisC/COQ6 family ubiquinone biosynthesis hydroxylase [Candidatus Paracaedibacter sp.]